MPSAIIALLILKVFYQTSRLTTYLSVASKPKSILIVILILTGLHVRALAAAVCYNNVGLLLPFHVFVATLIKALAYNHSQIFI